MAQLDLPSALAPSLKDRLFDPDSMGTKDRPGYTLRQILDSVREDLEDLLNTRRAHELPDARFVPHRRRAARGPVPRSGVRDDRGAHHRAHVHPRPLGLT